MIKDVRFGENVCRFEISNENDVIQAHLAQHEFFEANWLQDLLDFLTPTSVVVDVGANIGNHTVFFAKVAAIARVISFELHPEALSLLMRNVALNCPNRVDLSHIGVGCSDSRGSLGIVKEYQDNLGRTEFSSNLARVRRHFPSDTLDNMIGGTRVDFVKIDVESMEAKVLYGMSRIALTDRPLIYVEAWPQSLRRSLPILHWLLHHGYRMERVHGPNLLCVPIPHFRGVPDKAPAVVRNDAEAYAEVMALSKEESLAIACSFFLQGTGRADAAARIVLDRIAAGDDSRAAIDVLHLALKSRGGFDAMIDHLRSLHPIARSRVLRDEIILDQIWKGDVARAYCLACDSAGVESSTSCHAKSMMLQSLGLIDDAVEQARSAVRLAVFGRSNLMIRLADLIRVANGNLLEAKALSDEATAISPNVDHFQPVRSAIEMALAKTAAVRPDAALPTAM